MSSPTLRSRVRPGFRKAAHRAALSAGTLAAAMLPMLGTVIASPAAAQSGPPVYTGPANDAPGGDYRNPNPPPEPGAPAGYDGSHLPPPPPGYDAPQDQGAMREADESYGREAALWARDNCVKAHGDATAGAVIGGIFGAILGSGLSGRHDHGAGMVVGGALGAGTGAIIANSAGSNETSPGCPPGFVVRQGAPAYAYAPSGYYYAAPAWYRPWVFYDGYWVYRPYPYHDWYWRTYRGGRGWRGGPRGDWHGGRDWHHRP